MFQFSTHGKNRIFFVFLMFSGGIQRERWPEMGQEYFYKITLFPANIYLFKVNNRNTRKRYEIMFKDNNKNTKWRYLFKVSNRNTRKKCEICTKLTTKTAD